MSRWPTPRRAAHVFAVANIAFLGGDIAIAHMANAFNHRAEWIPLWFSGAATLLLLPGMLGSDRSGVVLVDRAVGWLAVALGVVGMLFHLLSGFFVSQTLHDLVYMAPFIAPLSYTGVGCLLLLLRSDDPRVGTWLLVLALGGFVGNFLLSVLDHAQNGFFHVAEWVPVASAALAIGYLVVELARPLAAPLWFAIAVLSTQVLVALAGFLLHARTALLSATARPIDRLVYGAPAFAPLLFANLALLAAIGLWARGNGDLQKNRRM